MEPILPTLGAQYWVGTVEGVALGVCLSVGHSTGMPGWRVAGGGMCGLSIVLL